MNDRGRDTITFRCRAEGERSEGQDDERREAEEPFRRLNQVQPCGNNVVAK